MNEILCRIPTVENQSLLFLKLIYVVIVFALAQSIESMVMTPLFVGDKIGLHPVAVIFAILAGGAIFGFLGILLALPVAAVMMVFISTILTIQVICD